MSNKKSVITRYSKGNKYFYLLPSVLLGVNQLCIYNLFRTVTDIVHSLHPQHLILCFELFGYTFFFGKLFYYPKKEFLRLLVNIGKIIGQLAARQQIDIADFMVLLDIPQMPLTPNADFNLWLFGERKARQIIIALQLIFDTCLFVVNLFFHFPSTFL